MQMLNKVLSHIVSRLFQYSRLAFYNILSTGRHIGHPQKIQPVLISGSGIVEFENDIRLGYYPSPYFFSGYIHIEARGKSSLIKIGADTHINNNFVAIAEHKQIIIGKRCLIGTNVEIYDSDFHGVKVECRKMSDQKNAKSVVIGDDVFIGSNSKLMKGVVIGEGSIIANGTIVVGMIPPRVIAGGNPVKVLKVIA